RSVGFACGHQALGQALDLRQEPGDLGHQARGLEARAAECRLMRAHHDEELLECVAALGREECAALGAESLELRLESTYLRVELGSLLAERPELLLEGVAAPLLRLRQPLCKLHFRAGDGVGPPLELADRVGKLGMVGYRERAAQLE